jgi:hypothetical protein
MAFWKYSFFPFLFFRICPQDQILRIRRMMREILFMERFSLSRDWWQSARDFLKREQAE